MGRSSFETSIESDRSDDSDSSENRIDPIEATSSSNATEDAQPFDVIISDIGMAEEDGYELMRKVRLMSHGEGGRVPAIALTGYATRKDRERALAAGYQLHIAKPVETDNLVAAIASLVKRNQ